MAPGRSGEESDGAPARPGRDADWAEVWGTRIGRVLGPVLLLGAAAVWLLLRRQGG